MTNLSTLIGEKSLLKCSFLLSFYESLTEANAHNDVLSFNNCDIIWYREEI